jgi:hypothetical protein
MPRTKKSTSKVKKVGRDSGSGEFISVAEATRRPRTTTVETVKVAKKKSTKKSR